MKRTILIVLISWLCITPAFADRNTIVDLSKAIKQHMITITATATGDEYNEHALKLKVKNTGSLVFNLVMNDGVIFAPDSTGYQPLILVGGEKVYMTALKETEISVQTFCANSDRLAPVKGLNYTFSKVANDTLVKILGYIRTNRWYNDMGQSAVWVFTNNHKLNTVYDYGNDFTSKKLLDFITKTTGMKMPEYFVQSEIDDTPGEEVYHPKTLKIFAKYELELDKPKTLTLGIYNEQGATIQSVFENRRYGKAGHRFRVEFEAKDVPAGKYYIRLKEGDEVLRETAVEVQ